MNKRNEGAIKKEREREQKREDAILQEKDALGMRKGKRQERE